MRKTSALLLSLVLMMTVSLACGGKTTNPCQPLPDIQATVDAAVASTCGMQAAVETGEALLGAAATATVTAMQPKPTPIPTEAYETMAEDKLETLINERVQMAAKTAVLAATQTTRALIDGAITSKELEILFTYWYYADEMIAYANEPITVYNDVYAELAAGTIGPLQAIDADLVAISRQAQTILPVLDEIGQALDQGSAQSSQALIQIATASETARAKAVDTQGQAQTWSASLQNEVQQRVSKALAVKAKRVAKNRKTAVKIANDYAKSVSASLADHKITQTELAKIAQLGANASASLDARGGAQLAKLASSVNEITAQIAGGKLPAARVNLASFQAALPEIP